MPMLRDEWLKDPAIQKWLNIYKSGSSKTKLHTMEGFLTFIQGRIPFTTPSDLIDYQAKINSSTDPRKKYEIQDALREYIDGRSGTRSSKIQYYSDIRSFFRTNRVPLPQDDFKIIGDRPPVKGKLTFSHIKLLTEKADFMLSAVYTTLFTGILDLERFFIFNRDCAEILVNHLKEKGTEESLLIEFRGRKQLYDIQPYYSFISRQALQKWREYFERERGYPNKGESIALSQINTPLTKITLQVRHLRLLERLHIIEKDWDNHKRRGYNLHEFRDVARTELHKKGRDNNINLDESVVEFLMGYRIDPNDYNKFYEDREYVKNEFTKMEKILSYEVSEADIEARVQDLLEERDVKIRKLTDELTKRQAEDASVEKRFMEMEKEIERIRKRSEKLADNLR